MATTNRTGDSGAVQLQEFRNIMGTLVGDKISEATTSLAALKRKIETFEYEGDQASANHLRLAIAERALKCEAGMPLLDSLVQDLKTTAGDKAMTQAAEPIRRV